MGGRTFSQAFITDADPHMLAFQEDAVVSVEKT